MRGSKMYKRVIIISWLLYSNTQGRTNMFTTLPLPKDVSTVDPAQTHEDLNNSGFNNFRVDFNYRHVSPGHSDIVSDDFSNSNLEPTGLASKDESKDLIKIIEFKNVIEQKKQIIKTDSTHSNLDPTISNVDPRNLSEDPSSSNLNTINSSKDPSHSNLDPITSNEDSSNSGLYTINSSEDPENSRSSLDPTTTNEDPETISKDSSSSNVDPATSNEDPETTNKDTETSNRDPTLGDLVVPRANIMYPSAPKLKPHPKPSRCLTGYMTDVQSWVDANGNLTHNVDLSLKIDLSFTANPVSALRQKIQSSDFKSWKIEVNYLSLAKCNLKGVPQIFNLENSHGKRLYSMVEYVTFFGNDFATISSAGVSFDESFNATGAISTSGMSSNQWSGNAAWAAWAEAFTSVTLIKLRELDLRKCSIQQLSDNIFQNMPRLDALYIGENHIKSISANAFAGLPNLRHLDLSRNLAGNSNDILSFKHDKVFNWLTNLMSLDLSFTIIQQRDSAIFKDLSRNLQSLSICYSGLNVLPAKAFAKTQIRYLDVSGNFGLLGNEKLLTGLQMSLEVIYARDVGLKSFDGFEYFAKLQIIDVASNEILTITKPTAQSLKNLKALNLDNNRFVTWWEYGIFSSMPKLKFLSLRDNNINFLSNAMIEDFKNIHYIGLSWNFVVCNCNARELFEIAYRNQNRTALLPASQDTTLYHRGFEEVNRLIIKRNKIERDYDKDEEFCTSHEEIDSEGNFTLFDFDNVLYRCLQVPEAISIPYSNTRCIEPKRADYYENLIGHSTTRLLFLLVIPALVFPLLIFLYVFRRNLKYFCITMKNSATLSLINTDKTFNEDTIFHYDVFVSYCNGDRNWVLDHLLPHVEKDCNVSVCLHERDFQVGLSILENIVSCMDRSRCIMLVISKQFVASQWCQFEMHLAQHRLLETRREDLILVLLEDVPRRMRPTTLHYLMLTKTYILWQQKESERAAFWKRLTRSLIARSRMVGENVSLA